MIKIQLQIELEFIKEYFNNLFCAGGRISKNKFWEFEVLFYSKDLLTVVIDAPLKGRDHAGIDISVGILGLVLNFKIYDNRHWDDENDNWKESSF